MVQVAFVGEGTSVVYLEPARINEETETREIGREDITICSKDLQGKFCLNNCILVRSRYYNILAHLRLYKELLNSTDLLFRPKRAT